MPSIETKDFAKGMVGEGVLQQSVVDSLWDIAGGDASVVRELIDDYATMATGVIADIEKGLDQNDARAVEHAAHSLKGSSAMMGAHVVRTASEAVERAAATGDLDGARACLPALRRAHEAALLGLMAVRDGSAGA